VNVRKTIENVIGDMKEIRHLIVFDQAKRRIVLIFLPFLEMESPKINPYLKVTD